MVLILTESIVSFHTLEFTVGNNVTTTGSVRVDLLGGTLDLNPINVILPNVVTLNLATSLKAKVTVREIDFEGIEIISHDYNSVQKFSASEFTEAKLNNGHFGNLSFVAHILHLFGIDKGVCLELESGSPPGAGLGGSSAMGVTCYSALAKFKNQSFNRIEAIQKVNALEAKILDCGPAGYQDYYPALFGGVLALVPKPAQVLVEQLYSDKLKEVLESHLTLVYSNETRNSGINNWEVYKAFFNKDQNVRAGLSEIARLSQLALRTIQHHNFEDLIPLIALEGEERRKLFPGILTPNMQELSQALVREGSHFGMKICGAGGGGCFLVTHKPQDKDLIANIVTKFNMKKLDFSVDKPL
jgi:D-glycero-alpha-D-manno-heptose-7-phosphate kinase